MSDFGVWCEIVCDGCNATIEGTYASTVFRERIRTKAVKAGWTVTDHEILCPHCVKLCGKKVRSRIWQTK